MNAGDIYLRKDASEENTRYYYLLIENHHTPLRDGMFMLIVLGEFDGNVEKMRFESHLTTPSMPDPNTQKWLTKSEMEATLDQSFMIVREARPNPFNFNMTGDDARAVLALLLEKHPDIVVLGNMYNRCAEIHQVQPPVIPQEGSE